MSKKKLTRGVKAWMAHQRLTKAKKEPVETLKIWEKRKQSLLDYLKFSPVKSDENFSEKRSSVLAHHDNKLSKNPNSIQTLKAKLREVKGNGKFLINGKKFKITSKYVREKLAEKSAKN